MTAEETKQHNIELAKAAMAAKKAEKEAAGLTLHWTQKRAIRAKCLECSNFQMPEVRNCLIPTCPIYPYRRNTAMTIPELKAWEDNFKNSSFGKRYLEGHEEAAAEE